MIPKEQKVVFCAASNIEITCTRYIKNGWVIHQLLEIKSGYYIILYGY